MSHLISHIFTCYAIASCDNPPLCVQTALRCIRLSSSKWYLRHNTPTWCRENFVISTDTESQNWIAISDRTTAMCHDDSSTLRSPPFWTQNIHQLDKFIHSYRFREIIFDRNPLVRIMLFAQTAQCDYSIWFAVQSRVCPNRIRNVYSRVLKKNRIEFRCLCVVSLWRRDNDDYDDSDDTLMMRWILFSFNHYDDSESDIIGLTYKVNWNSFGWTLVQEALGDVVAKRLFQIFDSLKGARAWHRWR